MALTRETFRQINALSDAELAQCWRDEAYCEPLRACFGTQDYEALRALLATPSAVAEAGVEVILLPGVMGSELQDTTGAFGKVWVDVLGLLMGGEFEVLQLDGAGEQEAHPTSRLAPVALYRGAYFKTRLWLDACGYTVHTFAYDWRKSIDTSARQLRDLVEAKAAGDPSKTFVFVAHSMGGLVVRRYLDLFGAQAEDRLDKLIMLGTPNHGTYLPLMVMKGEYPLLRVVGVLYGGQQARQVVQSFPGLYQMYPHPHVFGQAEIYQAAYWRETAMPQWHLDRARQFHQHLQARLPDKMFLIANRSLPTVTRVQREPAGRGWRYRFFRAPVGDGSVPFVSAYLEDVPTYETSAEHSAIQKDDAVLHALRDLINTGTTACLPRYQPPCTPEEPEYLEEFSAYEALLSF